MPVREVKLSLDVAALRSSLGLDETELPDDATDDQINEVLAAQASSGNPEPPAAGPIAANPEDNTDPDPAAKAKAKKPAAPAKTKTDPRTVPGGVVIDAGMWEQTQKELSVVRAEREKREQKEDQDYLTTACRAGKIPVTRVEHYQTLMTRDREGTREFIDSLPESLPMGHEYGGMGDLEDSVKAQDYPEQWLSPGERRRVSAARAAYAEGRVGDVEPGSIVRES